MARRAYSARAIPEARVRDASSSRTVQEACRLCYKATMIPEPQHFWTLVWAVYGLASLATFIAFGLDKRAAAGGQRRTPERVLHLLELAGGWPGALLGMAVWKHKRRKLSYLAVTALAVLAHLLFWAWMTGLFD